MLESRSRFSTRCVTIWDLAKPKKTTDDMLFTLETVSCLGACGLAPVMTINDEVFPSMTPETATQIIKDLKAKEE